MMNLLLKLLGARAPESADVTGLGLAFRGSVQSSLVLLLALLLGLLAWWVYRNSPQSVPRSRQWTLAALRALFLALLVLVLLRPVLAFTVEGAIRRRLVLLVDQSASMQIKDPRPDPDSRKRAAIALGLLSPTNGLAVELPPAAAKAVDAPSRIELLKGALTNPRLRLLSRLEGNCDLLPFAFGQQVTELPARETADRVQPVSPDQTGLARQYPWINALDPQSPLTALGDALRSVLARERGQPLAGVFLMTDGANNSGVQPREVARLFRQEGLPLYAYGLGLASPRDIIVASLSAPDVTFARDEVQVAVRVRGQGLNGQTARLKLSLDRQVVAEREVTFGPEAEQVLALGFVPPAPGDFELAARIDPRADEAVLDNNARRQRLKVIDARLKVLLVEQAPRWEFRYLQALLLRDRRIDLSCVLLEGDPAIARGTNSPYLAQFPQRKDELFQYDLVVLGDVDPRRLTVQSQEHLNELVSKFGGAVLVLAGRQFMPAAYRRSTLERMLPVELESGPAAPAAEAVNDQPIRLELTASGRASLMLRLSDNEEESAALWKELPPVYWVARVARAKPAAEVLVVDSDPARATRFGKMPVLALQHYGLGQVLYVGTDNTWRWRRNAGQRYYTAFWGQAMQRLAIQRLLGGSRRTHLATDRQNYMPGERVAVFARLYTSTYEPVQEAAVKGLCRLRAGDATQAIEVALRAIPDQPGLYRGEFSAPKPGQYQFFIEQEQGTLLDFNVSEPQFELSEPAMNEGLLRELAQVTGGAFLREEDLDRLPELVAARSNRVKAPLEVELWCSPLYFLVLLGVVSLEWVLRKRWHLK